MTHNVVYVGLVNRTPTEGNGANTNSILSFVDLQDTTLALDFRVTVLEENGEGDGNSSVAELEVRVETLEGTAVDHETRISDTELDINGTVFCSFDVYRIVNLVFT